jgi:hypothetical protein
MVVAGVAREMVVVAEVADSVEVGAWSVVDVSAGGEVPGLVVDGTS